MNIFISWSGDLSRNIAETLKDWIPKVLQYAKPYFTPSDIEKGSKWETEITKKLNECTIGILCLTSENTEKPWILFEAGALSNKLDRSRVCPLLFGFNNANLKGPLATFQTTVFERKEFKKLLETINKQADDRKVADNIFNEIFDTFFPKLEIKVQTLLMEHRNQSAENSEKPKRPDRDLLEEILELTRKQYLRPREVKYSINETSLSAKAYEHIGKRINQYLNKNSIDTFNLNASDIYAELNKDPEMRKYVFQRRSLQLAIEKYIKDFGSS